MTAITYETLSGLSKKFSALLSLLSNANRAMEWKPGAAIPLDASNSEDCQIRYLRVVKALLPRQQRRSERALGNILAEQCTFQESDRLRFLSFVARRLQGNLVPTITRTAQTVSVAKRLRCAVERSALSLASEEALVRFLAGRAA